MTDSGDDRNEVLREGRQVSALAMIGGLAVGIALGAATCSWFTSGRSTAVAPERAPTIQVAPAVVQVSNDPQRNAGVSTAGRPSRVRPRSN